MAKVLTQVEALRIASKTARAKAKTVGMKSIHFIIEVRGADGKRCEVFSRKPPAGMKVVGTYDSQHDARKAMDKNDRCKKG